MTERFERGINKREVLNMKYKNLAGAMYRNIARLSDEMIMETLNSKRLKPHLHDWKNWGANFDKMFAEIAHERGLIC